MIETKIIEGTVLDYIDILKKLVDHKRTKNGSSSDLDI